MGRTNDQLDAHASAARPAFTLMDLLVSLVVVGVLIGILLPSLARVHDASSRVVCASNLRQSGLAVHMFASDNDSALPPSSFASGAGEVWGSDPLYVRLDGNTRGWDVMIWDGLGILFAQEYLSDPRVFYCPSHTGENEFEAFAALYQGDPGPIVANYGYRGHGPDGELILDQIVDSAALVSDGFRDLSEINHRTGMNVLRAGMSVNWFADSSNALYSTALSVGDDDSPNWDDAWNLLDNPREEVNGWWFFN